MASFPSSKVHRRSRRSLSRGQHVQVPAVTVTPVAITTTVVFTFSQPVVVSGHIDLHLSPSVALVSQVQNSPTAVTQVYAATVVGSTWSVGPTEPVATFQGGALAAASGTF